MSNSPKKLKFNQYFGIKKKDLDKAGLFNISLVADVPLFIDPFHLFYSKKKKYRELHDHIIRYLVFLKENSVSFSGKKLPTRIIDSYYRFPEVKQNWFGFSFVGNKGRGLGKKFANALNDNFVELFNDFGSGKQTHHLEKITLITDRVGKDTISDFTTNLILNYLATETEKFTKKHIDKKSTREFTIKRAEFDFDNHVWKPKRYTLPAFSGDYVLLTPKDLLTKEKIWINRDDLVKDFENIPAAIPDNVLRQQLSAYFNQKLREYEKTRLNKKTNKPEGYHTQETKKKAVMDTLRQFRQAIDVYIKLKEQKGDQAEKISLEYVASTEAFLENQFTRFAENIDTSLTPPTSHEEALDRAKYFKECVELHDNYLNLYVGDEPASEDWIQRMFWLVWYGSLSDLNREPKNGLGMPDFTASQGKKDKTLIEFKLAKSKSLEDNILNQLKKYKEVNKTENGIWVIVFFKLEEKEKVDKVLRNNNLENDQNFILVDARKDNKVPASKIKS